MRCVIQRVRKASVFVNDVSISSIGNGLLVLVGFTDKDNETDWIWMTKKILGMRLFNDGNGIMNLSIENVEGELLIVSQFTLQSNTSKGNRPSYMNASKPDLAIIQYNNFLAHIEKSTKLKIRTGEFGADMQVNLINDGPVTIIIDSHKKDL